MSRGITKYKMKGMFPEVADILEKIESVNKSKHYWFFTNYAGKYSTPSGKNRTVSLGAIIDVLQENGFDVEINVKPNQNKKQLWEEVLRP